jgi:hypothetical protein
MALIVVGLAYSDSNRTAEGGSVGSDCPPPDLKGNSRLRVPLESAQGVVYASAFGCAKSRSGRRVEYNFLQASPGRYLVNRVEYDFSSGEAFVGNDFRRTRQRTPASFDIEAGEIVYIGDFDLPSVPVETIYVSRREAEARTAFALRGGAPDRLRFRPLTPP